MAALYQSADSSASASPNKLLALKDVRQVRRRPPWTRSSSCWLATKVPTPLPGRARPGPPRPRGTEASAARSERPSLPPPGGSGAAPAVRAGAGGKSCECPRLAPGGRRVLAVPRCAAAAGGHRGLWPRLSARLRRRPAAGLPCSGPAAPPPPAVPCTSGHGGREALGQLLLCLWGSAFCVRGVNWGLYLDIPRMSETGFL